MLIKSKILSQSLKVFIPLVLISVPVFAFAANGDSGRDVSPPALTVVSKSEVRAAYSGSAGTTSAQNAYLISTIGKMPVDVGDKYAATFTVRNDSTYPMNNVYLSSRFLSAPDSNDSLFVRLKTLHPGANYSYSAVQTYDGTIEPEELLMDVSAVASVDPNRMITEIGWPNIAVKTTGHKVVDSKAPLSGPGIRATTEAKVSAGGYTAITRFALTAVFDKCPTKAGDKLNITFAIQNGEADPTYRLRGTSEKVTIRGVDEKNGPSKNRGNFINLYSNVLKDPANAENTNLLHAFNTIGNSNNSQWTMPYTYKGKENLVALLSNIQVKSPIDTMPVLLSNPPVEIEFGITRSGAIALPNVCAPVPVTTTTKVPVPTTAPTSTTIPVSTTVPNPPSNNPDISVLRTKKTDGTFKYSVKNNGKLALFDIQILDSDSSVASFNVLRKIGKLDSQQVFEFVSSPLATPQTGFSCQAWYHPTGSASGIGVPCTFVNTAAPKAATTAQVPGVKVTQMSGWTNS